MDNKFSGVRVIHIEIIVFTAICTWELIQWLAGWLANHVHISVV